MGDNLPYAVEDESEYSIPNHGERRGLPHVLVEIRQDTLADSAGIDLWAARLTALLAQTMPDIIQQALSSQSVKE